MDDAYKGLRDEDGRTKVLTPDGTWLPGMPPGGFFWGPEGYPRQGYGKCWLLARELLLHRICGTGLTARPSKHELTGRPFKDEARYYRRAVGLTSEFLLKVVLNFPHDGWTLTPAQLDAAIVKIEGEIELDAVPDS